MQHPSATSGQQAAANHPDTEYSLRVRALELEGMSTSDAQGIADMEDLDDVTPVAGKVEPRTDIGPEDQLDQLNASVSEALRLIALGRIGEAQVVLHAAQERLDERVTAEAQS